MAYVAIAIGLPALELKVPGPERATPAALVAAGLAKARPSYFETVILRRCN